MGWARGRRRCCASSFRTVGCCGCRPGARGAGWYSSTWRSPSNRAGAVGDAERAELASRLPQHWAGEPVAVPRIADLNLRPPRIRPPAALAPICVTDPETRARHTYGKSYRDVVRALAGSLPEPPDL